MNNTVNEFHIVTDRLKILQQLVRNLNRPDIRSTTTLMGKVIGDRNATIMFLRLLYWFPKSRKVGGWVYKSWRDWEAECNMSQAQVKRVHRMGYLEQVGIERKTMKANGTPTTHYRLNEQKLLQALALFVGVPVEQVWLYLTSEPMLETGYSCPMGMNQTDQPEQQNAPYQPVRQNHICSVKSTQSITSIPVFESTNKYQTEPPHSPFVVVAEPDNQLINRLQSIEISVPMAINLISLYGHERVSEVCERVEKQHVINPAGYLIRALRENWKLKSAGSDCQVLNGPAYITGPYADFIHS